MNTLINADGTANTNLTVFCVRVLTAEGKKAEREGRRVKPDQILSTTYEVCAEGDYGMYDRTPSNMRVFVRKGEIVPHYAIGTTA